MKIQNHNPMNRVRCLLAAAVTLCLLPMAGKAQTLVSFNPAQMSFVDSYYHTTGDIDASAYGYVDIGSAYATPSEIDRPVLSFDLSSIPNGAVIQSATLMVDFTGNGTGGTQTINVNKLTTSWTASTVSWDTTNGTTPWTTAGGDFVSTPSSSLTESPFVGDYPGATYYAFTGLASDVQSWVNSPGSNNGWIMINGYEPVGSLNNSQIGALAGGQGPILDITYTVVPEPGSVALLGFGVAFMAVRFLRGSGNKEVS